MSALGNNSIRFILKQPVWLVLARVLARVIDEKENGNSTFIDVKKL
jgi:hypothetical protein